MCVCGLVKHSVCDVGVACVWYRVGACGLVCVLGVVWCVWYDMVCV